MIKNKKYKSFSLIEAMVLFTILSFMLLAFIPTLLKRPQKVMESECFGGLRSVKKEFTTPGTYTIAIPSTIASKLTVTLVGAGQGGTSPSITNTTSFVSNCGLAPGAESDLNNCYAECNQGSGDYPYSVNCMLTIVDSGGDASCDGTEGTAGASGGYYPKIRVNRALKYEKYSSDITHRTFSDFNQKSQYFSSGNSFLNGIGGEKGLDGNPKFLNGGYALPDKRLSGYGQNCEWDSSANAYRTTGDPGGRMTYQEYKIFSPGLGGQAGDYAKFTLDNITENTEITISVGRGGTSGKDAGNTSFQYSNGASNQIITVSGGVKDLNKRKSNRKNIPDNALIIGSLEEILNQKKGYASALAIGGREACPDSQTTSDCTDPNGKPGYLGSGGGAGTCVENGCGSGGRGGDGIAIIEYLEYCK